MSRKQTMSGHFLSTIFHMCIYIEHQVVLAQGDCSPWRESGSNFKRKRFKKYTSNFYNVNWIVYSHGKTQHISYCHICVSGRTRANFKFKTTPIFHCLISLSSIIVSHLHTKTTDRRASTKKVWKVNARPCEGK